MKHYFSPRWSLGIALAATALVSGSVYAAEVPATPDVAQSGKLTIANTVDYAPFEYLDADGKQTGIIIELAQQTAKLVGATLDIVRIPFPSMVPGLASGRFKIAWETFSATPDRLKQVDFLMFIKSGEVASTTPDKAASFAGDNNLCGKRVAVSAGTVADALADTMSADCKSKGLAEISKSVFNSAEDMVNAVLSDRVDARLDDATASSYFQVTSNNKLVVVPGLYEVAPLGLAIDKGDTATEQMMLAALEAMFKDGTYQKTLDKYGMGAYAIKEPYIVDSVDKIRTE
jgi:polar amino acid transport system substrate-binding protein